MNINAEKRKFFIDFLSPLTNKYNMYDKPI